MTTPNSNSKVEGQPDLTLRDLILGTFNVSFLSQEEVDTIIDFAECYAAERIRSAASTPPVNTNERLFTLDEWIRVEDRPLFIIDENGNWTCTKDGNQEIIAAVETNKGWWIKHCIIEDAIGLCVVGDMDNEPAGWDMTDITHWMPLPKPPKEQNDNKQ